MKIETMKRIEMVAGRFGSVLLYGGDLATMRRAVRAARVTAYLAGISFETALHLIREEAGS